MFSIFGKIKRFILQLIASIKCSMKCKSACCSVEVKQSDTDKFINEIIDYISTHNTPVPSVHTTPDQTEHNAVSDILKEVLEEKDKEE